MPGFTNIYTPGDIRHKSAGTGIKADAAGVNVTQDILDKINGYALSPLKKDHIYVRKQLLAHNGVDRDRERFSESLLDDFAATLPGKSTLYAHDRRSFLPLGLYFDAKTEEISIEKFADLTGENPRLPDGLSAVKVLWAFYYVVKTDTVADVLANIEGGTYRHWSIGFRAADIAPVKGQYEETLYWEYAAPGEATEGSLVWLGAQQGATSQKNAKSGSVSEEANENQQRGKTMKVLNALLGAALGKSYGDTATEESIVSDVKAALSEKDAKITELNKSLADSKAMADLGKKFQDDLAADYARMKGALGEIDETTEAVEKTKSFAIALDIEFLQQEVKALQKRMKEKFPDEGQLAGDLRRDKSSDGGGDLTGDKNPLVPQKGK